MKAAHTESADSRLPLSPRLGAWGVTYPAEKSCKFMDGQSVPAYRSAMACLSGSRCLRYSQGSMALCRADAKVQWQIWHFVLEECRCAYNAGPVGKRIDIWLWFICVCSCFKYYLRIFWKGGIKGVRDLTILKHTVFIPVWKSIIYLLCFPSVNLLLLPLAH